jgi:hypothetical protein
VRRALQAAGSTTQLQQGEGLPAAVSLPMLSPSGLAGSMLSPSGLAGSISSGEAHVAAQGGAGPMAPDVPQADTAVESVELAQVPSAHLAPWANAEPQVGGRARAIACAC